MHPRGHHRVTAMKQIIVGSRESRLAVIQTMTLVDHLRAVCPDAQVTVRTMKTTGDKILDRTLDKVGGKGLFVKELDAALLEGRIDLAVHSVKDLPMALAPGTRVLAYSRRADPRDALVLPEGAAKMKPGGTIGTSSLRRALQLKGLYPNCEIKPVRGNLYTRLQKLDEGQYDALVLAMAGLRRLGLEKRASRIFEPDEIIPAAGQGILAVIGREGEEFPWLKGYADESAALCALCERAFVRALDGGCTSPVCAHAALHRDTLTARALYYDPDTNATRVATDTAPAHQAEALGLRLAERLMQA